MSSLEMTYRDDLQTVTNMLAVEQLIALSVVDATPTGFDGDAVPEDNVFNPSGDESSQIPGVDPATMAQINSVMFVDACPFVVASLALPAARMSRMNISLGASCRRGG